MKRIFNGTLSLAALFFCLQPLKAQQHNIKTVQAQRIEVTQTLDRFITPDVLQLLAPYKTGVDSLMAPVLGVSDVYMESRRPESLLSNWISDVLKAHARQYGRKVDIGLSNMGGMRSAMPQGNVCVGDVIDISPFENTFCIVELKGKDLLELFAQIAKSGGEGISGAQLDISADGKLLSAKVGGKSVNPSKSYSIATIDYLAEGNDGLTALKKSVKRTMTKELAREVLMDAIRQATKANQHITARIEGRITIEGKRADELASQTDKHAPKEIELLIAHTNDTHSCIQPINPNSSDKERAGKAGYLRRDALVSQLREQNPTMLLFDCGDFSQGSAYYNLYKGEVEVKLMNHMRYDAAAIGNHEFDFGIENLARILSMADFPVVCCNYDFGATLLASIVRPYTIIERGGLRIGVLGVSPQMEGLIQEANYQGISYRDPVESANRIADLLRNEQHCDVVVALSHLGWTTGLNGDEMSDQLFISKTRNIDVVLGGHSHTLFDGVEYVKNLDGKEIPCNQMGKNGQFVGQIKLTLTAE